MLSAVEVRHRLRANLRLKRPELALAVSLQSGLFGMVSASADNGIG